MDGTNGDDTFEVRRVAGVSSYRLNGGAYVPISTDSVTFNGLNGKDKLIVDYSGGDPLPADGITFDGGGDPDDGLAIVGTATQTATYRPDAATPGAGVVTVDGNAISFLNLTPLDISGLASFTFDPPNDDDVLTVAAGTDFLSGGTNQALRVSGTSGGVAFESVAVWDTASLVIDTTTVDGKDTVTLASANNAHAVTSLTVLTGGNTGDSVSVTGTLTFPGSVSIQSGGSITVSGKISSGGAVSLTTTDAAATGQDITLAAGAAVSAGTLGVTLSAGDNLSVAGGVQITAVGGPISLAVDAGQPRILGSAASPR